MYYNISDDDLDQWFPNKAHSSNWLADRKNNDDDIKLRQKNEFTHHIAFWESNPWLAPTLLLELQEHQKGRSFKNRRGNISYSFVDVKGCRPINKQHFETNLSNRCNTI